MEEGYESYIILLNLASRSFSLSLSLSVKVCNVWVNEVRVWYRILFIYLLICVKTIIVVHIEGNNQAG